MLSRRRFLHLGAGAAVAAACGGRAGVAPRAGDAAIVPPPATGPDAAAAAAPQCGPVTADNIEGPYYRAGAPERSRLAGPGEKGVPLLVRGRVSGLTAAGCVALAGASLDVWQADADGRYDIDGSGRHAAESFHLRGRLVAGDGGAFEIATIRPGRYLNGRQYRPAHIHVKVSAPGFEPLTTQLYFPGDPYNDVDPFIDPSLIMRVEPGEGLELAAFDFVLTV